MEINKNNLWVRILSSAIVLLLISSCSITKQTVREVDKSVPERFTNSTDSTKVATVNWRDYFSDSNLTALIDTALIRNQELNILMQEIQVDKNEIQARKGEYLPFVDVGIGLGFEKEGKFTRHGAVDEQLEIKEGTEFPKVLGDFTIGAKMSWEIDIWKKLRNAKQAAVYRYLASSEGAKFMTTNLVAEIAENYYELMGLDNLLEIINENIQIQQSALNTVEQQKNAGKVTQLAVNRFEAQLLNTQNLQYDIKQRIAEAENKIIFLTGRFSTSVKRSSDGFIDVKVDSILAGIPAQLLTNRPDISQAEMSLEAAKLDVKVAKASFYPSLDIVANIGFQAFNPKFLFNPSSIFTNLAGDLMAPLINRNAIKAAFLSANAQQLQAVYNYEQAILNGYVDVLNQLAKIENYARSFETKTKEVNVLNQSVNIANTLFYSARADYAEVLLTQREALEARLELIEVQAKLLNGKVNVYRALGGGWK
jgi:NodT family efflux transporter outer membrane factor (OMF) lipoprotein